MHKAKRFPAALMALPLLMAVLPAEGATTLIAAMTGAAENPPAIAPTTVSGDPRPSASGTALFTINDDMTAMSFTAVIVNIDVTGSQTPDANDNLTAAHIHGSPTVTPTTNAGVVWGFIGNPFNETAPNDVVVTPFAAGVGGIISGKWDLPEGNNTTLTAQLPNILSEHTYINFHTVQFPGGEIRGTLTVVPEPSAAVLFAALCGLGLMAWRGRRTC